MTEDVHKELEIYIASLKKTVEGEPRVSHDFKDVMDDISYYTPTGDTSEKGKLIDKASAILTIITNIGMVIAVVMIAILGVKYMIGSVEEKADYKKDMIPYLIGAMLLFGITAFVTILQKLGETINNIN